MLFFIFSLIIVFSSYKNLKRKLQTKNNNNLEFLIKKLLIYNEKIIKIQCLDELFGINNVKNFESKRYKRAKIINELNTYYEEVYGKKIIMKKRNLEDKRIFDYYINTKS